MADAVVEAAAPAGDAQNNAKDTSNVESVQNENGAVKNHADSNEDQEETSKSEKKSFNGNSNSRSRQDDRKSKFSNRKRDDYRKNVKTNYASLPESSDPDEIRKQVEFYFSDSNLAYDDYMSSLVGGSANNTVPIKMIHSFKRMRRFQPFSAVVTALKESDILDVVNEDEIRRKIPFEPPTAADDEFNDPTIPRAIYAKGFGEEGPSTQFDIESFFTPYGPIGGVRLRRQLPSRTFKGSVFVEFETEEGQKEFLALEDKPKWNGKELVYMSKREYCDMKLDDIKSGKIQPNKKHQYKQYLPRSQQHSNRDRDSNRRGGDRDRNRRGNRDRRDGSGGGRRNRDNWKSRRDDFQRNGFQSPSPESEEAEKGDDGDESAKKKTVAAPDVQDGVEETKKRGREEDGADDELEQDAKKLKNGNDT